MALRVPRFALAILLIGLGTPFDACSDPVTVADFGLPPQDAAGWTILTPAAGSRLIYVDSVGGNDSTGVVYASGDPAIGANPQAPVAGVLAFRTLAAAADRTRQDQPDWLLLKAGGVWTESLSIKRGRSPAERAVVAPYGVGPRPELRTGTARGISSNQVTNLIVSGIRFWAHTRDSDGPHFTGYAGSSAFNLFGRLPTDPRQVRDILIEDCVFRAYSNMVLTGSASSSGNAPITRFVMRRSIVSGNYSEEAHAQGLYHTGSGQPLQPSVLLQENLFDHNGWRIQSILGNNAKAGGQATMFNHNTYFTSAQGVIFQRNLFLRASSIGNKWTAFAEGDARGIVIDDNLYAEGEIGISIGGNDPGGPLRFEDIVIRNNVLVDLGRTRPTNRSLSWGIDAQDWKSGVIQNNLVAHQRTPIGNTWALKIYAADAARDIRVTGNVFANLHASNSQAVVALNNGANVDNALFDNNIIHSPSANPAISLIPGGYTFAGTNRYHSTAPAANRFRINGTPMGLAAWVTATGDTGAIDAGTAFPDPTRDLEGYITHLGLGSDFDDFIAAVYGQSRANWNPALTAGEINAWLRGGFGLVAAEAELIFSNGFGH